jgi:hypothetical protein
MKIPRLLVTATSLALLLLASASILIGNAAPIPGAAALQDPCWSEFVSMGNGLSISFCEVNKRKTSPSDWTWKFRNDESTTVTFLKFDYIEHKGQTQERHHDIFPGSLKAGKVFGGWAAFLATSDARPEVIVAEMKRAPAPSMTTFCLRQVV